MPSVPRHKPVEFWESLTPTPRFWHLRHFDEEAGETKPNGGVTVAWRYFPDSNELHLAHAWCNESDHFNKSIGRKTAAGRLLSSRRVIIEVDRALKDAKEKDFRKAVWPLIEEYENRVYQEWHARRGIEL